MTPAAANPFDPAQIDVRGVFMGPDGSVREAIGFWYQDYERALEDGVEVRTPLGAPHFRVRFTPDRAGVWRWYWKVTTPAGEARSEVRRLRVGPSERPGFLRRSRRDDRYLAYDDGSAYFAVGENLCWYDARGSYAYDAWLAALAEQGANWARLWMPSWAMGIEWSDTGLGDYGARLDRAWQLDAVLAEAERRGIAVQLVLQNHGAFSTVYNSEWAANPYNAANGGILESAAEFWTDPEARALFQRRLRYTVARWGYSTAILAWELWNEAELSDGYAAADAIGWHREMADFLRAHDPQGHLVTTSYSLPILHIGVWNESRPRPHPDPPLRDPGLGERPGHDPPQRVGGRGRAQRRAPSRHDAAAALRGARRRRARALRRRGPPIPAASASTTGSSPASSRAATAPR